MPRPRRVPRRRPARKGPKKTSGLVKLIKKVATQVEKKHLETKYVAMTLSPNQPIESYIISGGSAFNLYPVIPAVTEGTGSYQRTGTRVEAQRLSVSMLLDFDHNFQENFDGFVRVWFLTNKRVKSQVLQNDIVPSQLLDNGQGGSSDWPGTDPTIYACYPVKNEDWTVLKQHTFKMSKNVAETTGSGTNTYATNVGHSSHSKNFSLKVPKNLIFDETTNATQYPNNHGIWMAITYWASDSYQFAEGEDVIRHTTRSHLYYKDG